MPRDSNGTYSLPAGNPVATLSVISSTWANTTLSDISTALTGSLDRSGQGAMLAGLKLFDGVIGAPGLSWGTETTSGLYRAGAGDFRWSISSTDLLQLSTNLFQLSGTAPAFRINETNGPANERLWDVIANTGSLMFRVLNDALTAANWLEVERTLNVIDSITLFTNVSQISGTAPSLRINETDGAANNRLWDLIVTGEDLAFRVLTDALVATNWLAVSRTAGTVDRINFAATLLDTAANVQATRQATGSTPALASFAITSGVPIFSINETTAAANNRLWAVSAQGEALLFRAWNDAGDTAGTWLTVERTGTTVDTINFGSGTLQYGGVEVGFKGLPKNNQAGNYTFVVADRGKIVRYTGGGGHTFSINNSVFSEDDVFTIQNVGSGTVTIAGGITTLSWMNGSGSIPTGGRVLAVGGVATVYMGTSSLAYIWGTGLT